MSTFYNQEEYTGLEVAVIGMDCRFPKARSLKEYWENLKYGIEGISFFEKEELKETGLDFDYVDAPNYVKAKGIIEDISKFDAKFFDYTPSEAAKLDPQIRIFHECVHNALEDSGYNSREYDGQIGLYAGCTESMNWLVRQLLTGEQETFNTSYREYLCTTVAYKLGLTGPSMTILSACSTSLVAVHTACQALLNGECTIAVAGGVNISVPQKKGYYYAEDLIFSPDGHCRTFDASSKGTLVSDGAGVVVLKPLQDAVNDGDHIYAVIKGSAVNNDGNRKAGFSAPGINGQKEVIETALEMAEVEPESIGMIEAHGTGTKVGDTIEIEALKRAFNVKKRAYCAIGSVKSNMGHLNEAAGIAGLIKAVLAIFNKKIPPTINFMNPNQKIEFEESPFYVNDSLKDWEENGYPLRAGVSSFGIGGTNAHIILEEPPAVVRECESKECKLIVLSAKTQTALETKCRQLQEFIQKNEYGNLDDIAYTLQIGREGYQYRTCFAIYNFQEYIDKIQKRLFYIHNIKKGEHIILYFFPRLTGDISVIRHMARLYQENKLFERELNDIKDRIDILGKMDFNMSDPESISIQDRKILHFVFDYAFAKVIMRISKNKIVLSGVGTGNLPAAVLSGILGEEEAVRAFASYEFSSYITEHMKSTKVPYLSYRTGNNVQSKEMEDIDFWTGRSEDNLCISGKLKSLLENPDTIPLSFSTESQQEEIAKKVKEWNRKRLETGQYWEESGNVFFLKCIGMLWSLGGNIKWNCLYNEDKPKRISLPVYPYEKKNYYLDDASVKTAMDLLKEQQDILYTSNAVRTYQKSWRRLNRVPYVNEEKLKSNAVAFIDEENAVGLLKNWNRRFAEKPILVLREGESVSSDSADYILKGSSKEDYTEILETVKENIGRFPDTIIYFAMKPSGFDDAHIETLEKSLESQYFSLVSFVQAIYEANLKDSIRLVIVTNNIAEVDGTEEVDPVRTSILAVLTSIPLECPQILCQVIDLTGQEKMLKETFSDILAEELSVQSGNLLCAYRGKYKWVPSYEPLQIADADNKETAVLKEHGVYLITGGTGGVGLELAEFLAKTGNSKIVLLGKTEFPLREHWEKWIEEHLEDDKISMIIRKIHKIEQYNKEIYVYQADLMDYDELENTVKKVEKEIGIITGVIHAVGTPGNNFLQNKEKETSYSIIMPKIKGCLYLEKLLKDNKLEFFVVCSSLSTVFPIAGQSDYNVANYFLDSYSEYSRNHGENIITSIKWDMWNNVGMAKIGRAPEKINYLYKPLIDFYYERNGKRIFFVKLSINRQWPLQAHRTEEFGLLSGTALLEMMREAVEETLYQRPFAFEEIHFLSPITVKNDEEKDVCLIIHKDQNAYSTNIYSRIKPGEDLWQLHTTGRIMLLAGDSEKEDVMAIREKCNGQTVTFSEKDNRNHGGYLTFGERWLNIRTVMTSGNQGLAWIELDKKYTEDLKEYIIHPGMMDSATSFLLPFIHKDGFYVPLSYEHIEVYKPLTSGFYSYCTNIDPHGGSDKLVHFNIVIMDEQGTVLLKIRNYIMLYVSERMIDNVYREAETIKPVALKEAEQLELAEYNVQKGIAPEEGQMAFGKIIATGYNNVIVSKVDIELEVRKNKQSRKHNTVWKKAILKMLPETERNHISADYIMPETETQKRLAAIYEEMLGIVPIGIDDDIFELGIESLIAIHISNNIRADMHVNVQLEDIFSNKTIRLLAKHIDEEKTIGISTITQTEKKEFYRTSYAQKRMYILQEMLPESVAYNETVAYWMRGNVEFQRIEDTFRKVINKHESLRTLFRKEKDEVVQVVLEQTDFILEYRMAACTDLKKEIDQFVRPFKLDTAPLFRACLIKTEEKEYVLVLDFHHSIIDGTSIQIIINDFAKAYMGNKLEAVKIQYKDFSEWQNDFMLTAQYKKQKTYWINQLSGRLPVLNLPYDYKRQDNISFNGGTQKLKLDITLSNAIKEMSQQQETTWFMMVLASYYVLLQKLSKEEDILVGIPQAGRSRKELRETVGMFVNTLILRIRPENNKRFTDLLEEVKQSLLLALENQDFQVEEIVDKLEYEREPGRNLLCDTIINYQSMKNQTEAGEQELEGIRFLPYSHEVNTVKADLNFHLYEMEGSIYFECFYRLDLFKKETIQYILSEFRNLLKQIVEEPEKTILQYDILKQNRVLDINRRITPQISYKMMDYKDERMNIVSQFEKMVFTYPEKIAIKHNETEQNFFNINQRANQLAWKILKSAGIHDEGKTVALLFANQLEMIPALLGAFKTGFPVIPVEKSIPVERIAYMIEDAKAEILLTSSDYQELAFSVRQYVKNDLNIIVTEDELDIYPDENPQVDIDKNKTACILYTSGSMGYPKGVIQTHRNLYYYVAQLTKELCVSEFDCIPLLTPYCHAIGLLDILSGLLNGASLKLYDFTLDGNMMRFANWLNREQITIFHSVPSVFRFFMKNLTEPVELPNIRMIMIGGEPVTRADFELYKKYCSDQCLFVNFLGCSEVMVISFFIADKQTVIDNPAVPAGYAVDGINVTVMNKEGNPAHVLESGELYYTSIYIADGYLNNPNLTEESILSDKADGRKKIFRSGDFGRVLWDGCIEYHGRNDTQIKIRGFRVDLQEIETAMDQIDFVKKSVVKAVKNEDDEYSIVAYYVLKEPAAENKPLDILRKKLPYYLIPQYMMELKEFPMTNTNKIDRNSLPEVCLNRTGISSDLPQSEIEKVLSDICKEVLQVENISIQDGFFELGGHSLKLMKIQNFIERRLNTKVEMIDIFKHPTIKELAVFIEGKQVNDTYLNKGKQRGEFRKNLTRRRRN